MASAAVSWDIFFALLSALILFVYGIEHFSERIRRIAGERFRSLLGRLTKSPWKGALLGAVATAITQSSTAITVISVSLVNAGTISFAQSLGIIIGANVGTTFTGQLLANNLASFGPVFIILGFLIDVFGKKYRFLGKPVFYFGLVFFSLTLVTATLAPFRDDPAIISLLKNNLSLPVALLAGIAFTILFQSSAVTSGVVVVLAQSGFLSLEQSIPIILGANIGTTATALFASSRMSVFAKRAAASHFVFNATGVIAFLALLPFFAGAVTALGGSTGQQVANAHVIVNLSTAIAFLLAIGHFKSFIEWLVKGDEKEIVFRTKFIMEKPPESNAGAFNAIENELRHAVGITAELLDNSIEMLGSASLENRNRVEKLGEFGDFLNEKIEAAIHELSTRQLSEKEALQTVLLVRMSNEIERIGDNGVNISLLAVAVAEKGQPLPEGQANGIREIYGLLKKDLAELGRTLPRISESSVKSIKDADKAFWEKVSREYGLHLKRLSSGNEHADSMLLEALSLIEAISTKTRELRKLSEMYPEHETGGNPVQENGQNV
ncbi:MAG: Na/Pi cotransporter family protein [Candidatus Diapherotrites archaeon]|nr:Na/Pi cotransporter family protein [Candidatus Diapherotrites archaeon]